MSTLLKPTSVATESELHAVPDQDPTPASSEENLKPKPLEKTQAEISENADKEDDVEDESSYPTGVRLILIVISLCFAVFLFALDGTILATALPVITTQFNSLDDIAWYSAAFFTTTCAFQLPFGRAYTLLNTKWTYLFSVFIFLVGSAVCGAAPNSMALIIGRAIAGIGGAGVVAGVFIIIAKNIPLRKRSLYAGFIGASLAISSVIGPLIGGILTTNSTWRWCFYLNLPVGAVIMAFIFFSLPNDIGHSSQEIKGLTWFQFIRKFNPVGAIILLVSVVCLLLALQWGGGTGDWKEPRVIASISVFAVTWIVWCIMQYIQGDEATLPWKVAKQRSVLGATLYTTLGSAAFTIIIYWVPIWFQTVRENDAEESGIRSLPLTIGIIVFSIAAGGGTMLIGYYTIFLLLGTVFLAVGAGTLMLLRPDSGPAEWIGYQVIFAAGVGMSLEQCNIAIQTVLGDDQIPAGTSLIIFARSLAGAIGIAIGQKTFQLSLVEQLRGLVPDDLLPGAGATDLVPLLRDHIGNDPVRVADILGRVNKSCTKTFMVTMIMSCLTLPCALLVEWKSVKKAKKVKDSKPDAQAEDKEAPGSKQSDTDVSEKV